MQGDALDWKLFEDGIEDTSDLTRMGDANRVADGDLEDAEIRESPRDRDNLLDRDVAFERSSKRG